MAKIGCTAYGEGKGELALDGSGLLTMLDLS